MLLSNAADALQSHTCATAKHKDRAGPLIIRQTLGLSARALPQCCRRFSCPVQIGNSYRVAYVKARGHTCFDHNYYITMAPDLKVLPSTHDLFLHYAGFGQFENRQIRCGGRLLLWHVVDDIARPAARKRTRQ